MNTTPASETPRTDAICQPVKGYADTFAPRYKVEELERELLESQAQVVAMEKQRYLHRRMLAEQRRVIYKVKWDMTAITLEVSPEKRGEKWRRLTNEVDWHLRSPDAIPPELIGQASYDQMAADREVTQKTILDLQAQVLALRDAHDTMRDAVLHERHQLAEENAPVNAILGIIDDAFAVALSATEVVSKERYDALWTHADNLADVIKSEVEAYRGSAPNFLAEALAAHEALKQKEGR